MFILSRQTGLERQSATRVSAHTNAFQFRWQLRLRLRCARHCQCWPRMSYVLKFWKLFASCCCWYCCYRCQTSHIFAILIITNLHRLSKWWKCIFIALQFAVAIYNLIWQFEFAALAQTVYTAAMRPRTRASWLNVENEINCQTYGNKSISCISLI